MEKINKFIKIHTISIYDMLFSTACSNFYKKNKEQSFTCESEDVKDSCEIKSTGKSSKNVDFCSSCWLNKCKDTLSKLNIFIFFIF